MTYTGHNGTNICNFFYCSSQQISQGEKVSGCIKSTLRDCRYNQKTRMEDCEGVGRAADVRPPWGMIKVDRE